MEIIIKNTFKKIFENHRNLQKCKEMTKDLVTSLTKVKTESETNTGLIQHLITKIIRHIYQEILIVFIFIKFNNVSLENSFRTFRRVH